MFTPEIIYEGTFVINKNKSPKDESFVSVREEFVRPLGSFVLWVVGIAGRHAYVRDFVVCVWSMSIVRISGKARIT